jgi:beta-glucosidase
MTFPLTTGHIPTSTHQRPTGRLIERHEDDRLGRYLDDLVFPRLPFGHGLTYTTFEYGRPRLSSGELPLAGEVEVEVDVTNTGDRAAREVVQLYFRDPLAEVTRPLTELLDWQALVLAPGEKATARFRLTATQFAYYGRDNTSRTDSGEILLRVGPDALRGEGLSLRVTT